MADSKTKTPAGGNTPKPTRPGGQSAKDRSRAQSRSVSEKAPAGRGAKAGGPGGGKGKGGGRGGGGGGNTPRPGRQPAPAAPPRRISGTMMAWGAVTLVVIIVVVLVVVKATGGSSTDTSYTPVTPAPAQVVHDVTNIPLSVYDKVGVSSPQVPVNPPKVLSGQPALTLDGKTPAMLYVGAEYCPYCAAERWAMTAALSRFGTWSGLKITASSHTDVDAITHTFSYYGATFSSPYLTFRSVELDSNIPCASCTSSDGYKPLQSLTKEELAVATKYNSSKYNPYATTDEGGISFPFVSIDNKGIVLGASYDPGILAGQTWSQIAGGLHDAGNIATQAIVTTANYMTAMICQATKGQPGSVCTSSGVQAAAKALKLG